MYSQLVDESTRKNYIEEIEVFDPPEKGGLWTCPFCDPSSTVYQLQLPDSENTTRLEHVKKLIKDHIELHRQDLLNKLSVNNDIPYDKARLESIKRVRLWITGTISDRRLYEEEPI